MKCEDKNSTKAAMMSVSESTLKIADVDLDSKTIKSTGTEGLAAFGNLRRLDLSFSDVCFKVRKSLFSTEKRKILWNVSGHFRAGELTAIMGPSGAGKTVLMDVLAGLTTTNVTGDIKINGKLRNLKDFRRTSAYIMQNQNLYDLLTVEESMYVAAELKLKKSSAFKKERINILLKDLGLEKVRATYAGRLSGGQQKRLAIALELISDLPIMFLDEPTTGLDSATTRQCLELLKSLAVTGRTIICTIHQPSASLFHMLDNVYVVARGQCIYTGTPHNVRPFLSSLGLHCPNYHNPADFLLEVASGEYGDHASRMAEAIKSGSSERYRSEKHEPPRLQLMEEEPREKQRYPSSSFTQVRVLFWRYAIRTFRDREYIMIILIAHFIMAFIAGLTFQGVGREASRSIDNLKQLAFNLIFISFCAINAALVTFPAELPIISREYFNRWYRLRSVYIANKIMGFIIISVCVSSYTIITYYLSNQLAELDRLGYLMLSSIVIALVNQASSLLISVALKVKNVIFFGPYSAMPFVLFSGIFVRYQDVHPYLSWMYNISVFKYAYDGFTNAIYGFNRPRMPCSEEYCMFMSPKSLLQFVGTYDVNYWFSTSVLIGVYVVLHFMTFFVLRWRLKRTSYR